MKTLNKRIKRNIKNNLSFYLISTILTMLITAFIIAAASTGNTLTDLIQDYMKRLKVENAEFSTYITIPDDEITRLEKEYDVLLEENSYKDIKEGEKTLRVFKNHTKVNLSETRDGREAVGLFEGTITENYAKENGISVNDVYSFGGMEFVVTGYTTKGDYLFMLKDAGDMFRDNVNFGIINVTAETYDRIDAEEKTCYAVIYNQKENELDFRKRVNADYIMKSYIAKDSNPRISSPESEGEGVSGMAKKLSPILFIIVIALVVMVLGRMIRSEQTLLGTFMALGVTRSEIIRHYVIYGIIPGIVGSVLGLGLSVPFTKAFSAFYIENDYEKLIYETEYNIPACLVALLLPSLLYVLTVLIVSRKLLKASAIELLNNTGKDTKTINILRKRRIRTGLKLKVRSIVGHPGRSAVTVLGVMIASILLLLGFVMKTLMTDMVENGIKETIGYEYLYYLNYLGDADKLPEGSEGASPVLTVYYEIPSSTNQVNIWGVDKSSEYFKMKTMDGEDVDLNGYYITNVASNVWKVKKGDILTFYSIADLSEHSVEISGIIDDNMHTYMYTSIENASRLAGFDGVHYNAMVSGTSIPISADIVASTVVMSEHSALFEELMGPIDAVVYIIIVFGALLCIFIMYLVINMIVGESKTGISVMKVLGFSKKEIGSRVLDVNMILVIIGFLVGIPLTFKVAEVGFADTIEEFGIYFKAELNLRTAVGLLIGFVIIFIAYEISLLLQKRKIAKINMVEALKENRRNE